MRLIDADELKSMYSINRANFNTVVGIQKWIDNAPTVQAVPIEKIKTLINDIEVIRTSPALIDNDEVQRFAENVLYALNRLIEGSDTE